MYFFIIIVTHKELLYVLNQNTHVSYVSQSCNTCITCIYYITCIYLHYMYILHVLHKDTITLRLWFCLNPISLPFKYTSPIHKWKLGSCVLPEDIDSFITASCVWSRTTLIGRWSFKFWWRWYVYNPHLQHFWGIVERS